ncbi:MAG: holo-ACP synthase [Proteobacteria bacterium]|nr:holo-ACP synthase [Pseudomonadota bacterium]
MILGIGIDLVSVERIQNLEDQFGKKFLQKIFTKNESAESKKKISSAIFLAKRFAAKEAFSKALGLGIGRGINFQDIEVENDDFGKPRIKILNEKNAFIKKHFNCENFAIHLSLSDEKSFANAIVLIEKIS